MLTRKELFQNIFKNNSWGDDESASGPGSRLECTKNIRKILPKLIKMYNIKSLADIPCGDMNWFSKIHLKIKYYGFDIVEDIIKINKEKYKWKRNYHFETKDALIDDLPKVDLILCRDLIIHFPLMAIYDLLKNFLKSGSKYLLISHFNLTNSELRENKDIEFGHFHYRNLTKPPFNFPQPEILIPEDVVHPACMRYLALYELKNLAEYIDR